ncbi:OmpH family outer membrane protein [Prevotella jejuni]|uniref:OmpH family outer membrane protein n=1 Tax=Prevotella jejuni TaxID=1177574 RepID=UPI0028E8D164|nr:OmpH family outer membrane protein [Prevotella jejuni]
MKKLIFSFVFMLLPLLATAQQNVPAFKFAYFSYDKVFRAMADYAAATRNLNDLKAKYDAETKRSVEDFNNRYEDFLDVQRKLEPSILRKRQAELEELMDRNIAFRKESERLLKKAEEDIYAPVRTKLNNVVREMGKERGYAFVLNTDNNGLPFANTTMGEDITDALITVLK